MDAPHHKLRMKIGPHEFEAEGTVEEVNEQFAAWKEIVLAVGAPAQGLSLPFIPSTAQVPPLVTGAPTTPLPLMVATEADAAKAASSEPPPNIFVTDDRRRLVWLRVHPPGESRASDAALLVLYGLKRLMNVDEPLAGQIKDALEESGIRVDRVDRITLGNLRDGLLLKSGFGKGGKYRLTMTGLAKAESLAKELASQMA